MKGCKDYFKCDFYEQRIDIYKTSELFEKYNINKIDFLSIDTESYDENVINGIDFNCCDITLICIEHMTDNINNILIEKNYSLRHKTIGNYFYKKIDTKMKILIIQEAGRHIKNKNFRESLNFQRAFQKIGVESIVWGLNYPNFNLTFEQVSKDCGVVLLIENYNTGWLPNISNFKGLKMFWSIDSHCVPDLHSYTCDINKIDIVLNAIESHSKYFKQKTYYLPNAYPDDLIYNKVEIQKNIDVGFCGNWVNRQDWILSIPNIKKDIMVIGDDMVNAINSFKIHFNRNMSDDINYRTFETLGCKTFLLTNYTENLDKLFNIGEHLITYTTKQDLSDKVRYYLDNPDIRERIANSGYEHVKKNHTYVNRAQEIMKIILENNKTLI